ncbi:MAG: hypothetical protein EOM19_06540 [Candidatus Moranbacteria bacterium]|nr:hypothetical protein [Candidatus Moranbacteria bacterium]
MSESSKKSINSGRFKKGSIPFSKLHPELSPRGEQHWKWSGGKTKTVTGYIWEYAPDHPKANHGYVYQHRLVIERILKRKLKSSECVHHISEKTDNHPSKLIVFSSNSAHMRFHKSEKNVYPDEIIFDGRSYV